MKRNHFRRRARPVLVAGALLLSAAFAAVFAPGARAQRLPTGQILRPYGTAVKLTGTMAANVLLAPGHPWVLTVCSGTLQSLCLVDPVSGAVLSHIDYQTPGNDGYQVTGSVFDGLAISGSTAYAARGSEDKIGVYRIGADGTLTETGSLDEPPAAGGGNFPAGVAVSGDGGFVYASNNMSDTLAVFDAKKSQYIGAVPVASYPLAVAALPDGSKVYVSSERDGVVSVVDPVKLVRLHDITTGAHPDALLLSKDHSRLFVANGDGDTVSIVDTATDHVLRTILVRPDVVRGLPGATPTGLALSPDERTLYISLADLNAVALVKLSMAKDDGALAGFIPAGWYPTAVAVSATGRTLYVADGKGTSSGNPNPNGPGPLNRNSLYKDHNLLTGALSVIPIPAGNSLKIASNEVLAQNSIGQSLDPDTIDAAARIAALPIKHVIYIIKENRTYDQVLGDLTQGNGDPSLVLFGSAVTPNEHALAQRFVLLDNFYCCAEVSPDGWNWSTSGLAEEYTQRTVPENYSEHKNSARPGERSYDYEGENRDEAVSLENKPDVAQSPGGYIWDDVVSAGLTLRNYGCFLTFAGGKPDKPVLANGNTCADFAPFDLKYADSDAYAVYRLKSPGEDSYGPGRAPSRYSAWKAEFDGYVKNGNMPSFEIVRMPRDHTSGTAPGLNTPQAMAADNDYGVGEIVQAVSNSIYWQSTAIVVVEDDAQNGPDHVDCHRSTAYVISPYVVPHSVDHHFYNTDSLLRTMELILHIPAMTRLDSSAPPVRDFRTVPDLTPYHAILPGITMLESKNTRTAFGASTSRQLNFAIADDVPDQVLNRILWYSIKGVHQPMPAIRGAAADSD